MTENQSQSFDNGLFYSASQFYKEIFGVKTYKISLMAARTCPNRDGSKAYGGCIFCSEKGSGDFAESTSDTIKDAVARAKVRLSKKIKEGQEKAFVAYFQSFSNTYGDPDFLKNKFLSALACPDVRGLSIATRPDCFNPEIISVLQELSRKAFLQVELGLQTSNEKTGEYIRRFYTNQDYEKAVKLLKANVPDCHIVTHLIYGLPGENIDDMLNSLDFVLENGSHGIKIASLHVLKNTQLCKEYLEGRVKCLEMDEYFDLLGQSLLKIPEDIVVHRLTGDGDKKLLLAPLWTWEKRKVLNSMNQYFKEHNIVQGRGL